MQADGGCGDSASQREWGPSAYGSGYIGGSDPRERLPLLAHWHAFNFKRLQVAVMTRRVDCNGVQAEITLDDYEAFQARSSIRFLWERPTWRALEDDLLIEPKGCKETLRF